MTVTYMFTSRREAREMSPETAEMPDAGRGAEARAETVPAAMPNEALGLERVRDESLISLEKDRAASAASLKPKTELAAKTPNLPVKWKPPHSRLILVGKARGGVGATSLATNLAIELQSKKSLFGASKTRKVALVDLDVQFGNVASFLDLEDRGGMLELLRLADEPDAHAVRNAMLKHASGVSVLAAPRSAVPLEALDSERMESIVAALMSEFEYVVVDLPPALVPWLEPLLRRATELLMVSDLSVPSVACARRVIDLMHEDNRDLPVEIVVTREAKPLIQRKSHRLAADALGLPLSHWLPDEPKLFRLALDRGEPMAVLSPRSAWTKAVRHLAASLDARTIAENEH